MKPTCLLVATACFLSSCNDKGTDQSTRATGSSAPESGELQAVLATPPEGEALSIHAARTSAKPGDKVTLKGRIMGNAKPFVEGRSAFILGDPEILSACNDKPGDECETPWDACCNTPEEKKKGTATIQITGADGRVLKESIEDVGGIAKLATVLVTGTVAAGSSPDLLIVNAIGIRAGK